MQVLADRLRALRESLQRTQPEAAEEFGVSVAALQGWESDRREPSLQQVVKFAHYFNVSADYLLGLTDRPEPLRPSRDPVQLPELARWLRAVMAERHIRLPTVATKLQMSESLLRKIHDGGALYVPPRALRELAAFFSASEAEVLAMAPQGENLANHDPQQLIGVAVYADETWQEEDRATIVGVAAYLRDKGLKARGGK